MLGYDYIKNHYNLIAVDLSRQKESDADPKAIQQIEFVGPLKNVDGVNVYLSNFRKNQRNKRNFQKEV